MSVTDWLGGVTSYGYDAVGNHITTTNANGTTVFYGYDADRRLRSLTNSLPDGTVIAGYAITLDGLGNPRQVNQDEPLFPLFQSQTNNYTHDADNRLASINGVPVGHDRNGCLTNYGPDTFRYDVEDRLIESVTGGVTNQAAYDGLGARVSLTTSGITRRFVLDRTGPLTQVLAETDASGTITAYYLYGRGLIARITPDGQRSTHHFDLRGSTVALTGASGSVTDKYAYTAFGMVANREGGQPNPFRYLGRYGIMDDGNGLSYARARYFSPSLGRFLTKDPLLGNDEDGQSLHRYAYALNNPLRLVDVTGLSPQKGGVSSAESAYWGAFDESFYSSPGYKILQVAEVAGLAAQVTLDVIEFALQLHGLAELHAVYLRVRIPQIYAQFAAKSGTQLARELGGAGEQMSGIVGPKTRIPSLTGTANYRVPDELIPNVQLRDAKNVGELRITPQLIDFGQYSQQQDLRFILDVRQNTVIGPSAQQFINQYGVQINRIYPAR